MDHLAEIRRLKERSAARVAKLEREIEAARKDLSELESAERVFLRIGGSPDLVTSPSDSTNIKVTEMVLEILGTQGDGLSVKEIQQRANSVYGVTVSENTLYGTLPATSRRVALIAKTESGA